VTKKRPFQDDSIFYTAMRQFYSASILGRPEDPYHEEPFKYTQTLNQCFQWEAHTEWVARLCENKMAAQMFIKGELTEEAEKLARLTGTLEETGLDETMGGMESGSVDAMEGIESALGIASDTSALEVMDDVMSGDVLTTYGFSPPIINLPISLSPAVIVMLTGNSEDTFYHNIDTMTLENLPYLEDWHYEDGVETARTSYFYENAEDILERRHMRTGEKIRYICVQRPAEEGGMLVIDVLKDVRNERFSEYALSPMYGFPYPTFVIPDCQSTQRSLFDFVLGLVTLISAIDPERRKKPGAWPHRPYTIWIPLPGIMEMLIPLPLDVIVPRFIGILTGVNFNIVRYNLTALEGTMELVGQEIINATPFESSNSYLLYGMDRMRYPSTYIQSKRVYGQEAHIREPTEYPLPEGATTSLEDAANKVIDARKEHPEWLTSIKGVGN